MMKKCLLFSQITAFTFLILVIGLLGSSGNFFGQASIVVAAQPPDPETLSTPTPTPATANLIIPNGIEVIVDYLNLREGPGLESSVIGMVQAGDVLTITNVSPDLNWIEILTADDRTGWVSSAPEYVSLNTIMDEPLAPVQSVETAPVLLASTTSGRPDEFGLTRFEWEFDGPLPEDLGFEVRVWREGEERLGVHDAVLDNTTGQVENLGDNIYGLTVDISEAPGIKGAGDYLWTVEVAETGRGYEEYETIGVSAEPAPLGIEIPDPDRPAPLALVVADPANPCGLAATVEPDGKYAVVKIFYGTDRNVTGDPNPRQYFGGDRGILSYGTATVSIPRNHKKGEIESPNFWLLEWRQNPERYVTLLSVTQQDDESLFFADLRSRIESSQRKQAFVFIHGYNVNFEDAARRTAQMACDLNFDGAPILYSWPSDGTIIGYTFDEADVEWTVPHLKTFLEDIGRKTEAETIYIIGHSMGNRAMTNALREMLSDSEDDILPIFREVVMAAADIDRGVFIEQIAPPLTSGYQRLTLYASSDDKALRLSRLIHRYARVGDFTDGPLVFDSLDSIDATGVDPHWLGHGYYAAPSVIDDLDSLLRNGNSPAERSRLTSVEFPPGRYWVFLP